MGDTVTDEEKVSLKRRGPVVIQVRGWYPLLMMGLVMVLLTVGNIVYTNRVDGNRARAEAEARAAVQAAERKADRRWCTLMILLDGAYNNPATQPTTSFGREMARAIHEIRLDLGC